MAQRSLQVTLVDENGSLVHEVDSRTWIGKVTESQLSKLNSLLETLLTLGTTD